MIKNKENNIRAIVWDIGGVLSLAKNKRIRNKKNLVNSITGLWVLIKEFDTQNESLLKKFKSIYYKSSRGKISKEETLKALSKIFKNLKEKEIKKIITDTYKNNSVENKEIIKFISKLKNKGYKQGILSNQWCLSKDIAISKKNLKLFSQSVISFIDKEIKPDKKAFQLILDKMYVSSNQVIFIDDLKTNIDAAKKLGIHTILFKNNTQLKKDLAKFGVK
jgi:epoxide hydrolase-like predicted phosphatase